MNNAVFYQKNGNCHSANTLSKWTKEASINSIYLDQYDIMLFTRCHSNLFNATEFNYNIPLIVSMCEVKNMC